MVDSTPWDLTFLSTDGTISESGPQSFEVREKPIPALRNQFFGQRKRAFGL